MIYECENCGKEFEVAEPICPKCHSGDVIEYNDKIDELESRNKYLAKLNIKLLERLSGAIEFINNSIPCIHDEEILKDLLEILEGEE